MSTVLLGVDGANMLMRGFHGARLWDPRNRYRPDSTVPRWPDELPGILRSMLRGALRRHPDVTHLVVALDHPAPCFRYALWPNYKAGRANNGPSPTDLTYVVRPWLRAWGVATVEAAGWEADDLLAALAARCVARGSRMDVLTRDEDLLQVVDAGVRVLWPDPRHRDAQGRATEVVFGEREVVERTGVSPGQVPDWKALSGCASDGLPRVGETYLDRHGKERRRGLTPARAAELLQDYWELEGVYEFLGQLPEREQAWLRDCREQAFLVRRIVRLDTEAPLAVDPAATSVQTITWDRTPEDL